MTMADKPCPKQASGHHCDHLVSQRHYTQPKDYQCCFCGRVRVEQPQSTSTTFTFRREDHGEFYPETRVMY